LGLAATALSAGALAPAAALATNTAAALALAGNTASAAATLVVAQTGLALGAFVGITGVGITIGSPVVD
jgi:hypothetical protein